MKTSLNIKKKIGFFLTSLLGGLALILFKKKKTEKISEEEAQDPFGPNFVQGDITAFSEGDLVEALMRISLNHGDKTLEMAFLQKYIRENFDGMKPYKDPFELKLIQGEKKDLEIPPEIA